MDAIQLLTEQHREVESLFANLRNGDEKTRYAIANKIAKHAFIEEAYFYPELARRKETKEFVEHAVEEHNEVKRLMSNFMSAPLDDFMGQAGELQSAIDHHVKEEEGKMFKAVREAFSIEELYSLGTTMQSGMAISY